MEAVLIIAAVYIIGDKISNDTMWVRKLLGNRPAEDQHLPHQIWEYPPNPLGADPLDLGRTSQWQGTKFEATNYPKAYHDPVFYEPGLPLDNSHNYSETHWGQPAYYFPTNPTQYATSGEDAYTHDMTIAQDVIAKNRENQKRKTAGGVSSFSRYFHLPKLPSFSNGTVDTQAYKQQQDVRKPRFDSLVSEDDWFNRKFV